MKHYLLLFLAISSTFWPAAQEAKISNAKITFEFPSKNVKGTIEGFESTSKIDWESPANSVFEGSVESETLDTNNGLRNWSLRSSRYFAVKDHPKISFVSKEVRKSGTTWLVSGDLTLKGITKSFRIDFEQAGQKLKGKGALYSSDFDINIKKEREDNLVNVYFELELYDQ
ncbi:YceI family protein [Flagellimonas meishanensis]|uniref:YceI family protein n=1 Tax=Flagellimonas meishanensis TaxID=2873264 RepID=UPI001CA6CA2A|nr:YceI family protein [[Muricauda] meishanensis]